MNVTLGGDRLGSGNKNKIWLNNFNRSTHNLSTRFTSTAGCGMLIPCLVKPVMRGDVFDININGACRTLPTQSPMFSTFKMQTDIFFCPARLYQGILHNNPLFIGLKMKDVMFPQLRMIAYNSNYRGRTDGYKYGKMADNCLLKYLGLSGMGNPINQEWSQYWLRDINAIPMLAYYDIFKNYYANKQEDDAYVLSSSDVWQNTQYPYVEHVTENNEEFPVEDLTSGRWQATIESYEVWDLYNSMIQVPDQEGTPTNVSIQIVCENDNANALSGLMQFAYFDDGNDLQKRSQNEFISAWCENYVVDENTMEFTITTDFFNDGNYGLMIFFKQEKAIYKREVEIKNFALENIDEMRLNLLSHHTLGTPYVIKYDNSKLPYLLNTNGNPTTWHAKTHEGYNLQDLNGLMLKTYQADLFNAWLNTEWLDGENGIAEMSKIAVQDGAIYIDAMILAEKTFKMLNRIAVAGGTYEAWQDVVYQESERKHIESPIYCGGQSYEVVFEEIVQTTPTEGAPLGTLGGRGLAVKRKGGNVSIKVDEAGFIIGIVSITPRVYYTQGNEFYLTELESMDDLHKPNLDGIGFQNLLGERMVWSDAEISQSTNKRASSTIVGKVPAWVEYMTDVDRAYGEFCDLRKQGSMILGRHYETDDTGKVQDFTTYIDPSKFNYAFGNANLTAQNFWVQIDFDIKARRLMSAKQMPNL